MSGRSRRRPDRPPRVSRAIPKPAPVTPRYPWLVPVIVVVAVLILAAAITWAISIGVFFTFPPSTPTPSRS